MLRGHYNQISFLHGKCQRLWFDAHRCAGFRIPAGIRSPVSRATPLCILPVGATDARRQTVMGSADVSACTHRLYRRRYLRLTLGPIRRLSSLHTFIVGVFRPGSRQVREIVREEQDHRVDSVPAPQAADGFCFAAVDGESDRSAPDTEDLPMPFTIMTALLPFRLAFASALEPAVT